MTFKTTKARLIKWLLVAIPSIVLTVFAVSEMIAHSGGTDSQGGHYNRKTGEYHFHNRKSVPVQRPSPSRRTAEPAEVKKRFLFYVKTNENDVQKLLDSKIMRDYNLNNLSMATGGGMRMYAVVLERK